jgi:metal-responsive CopG/Arc/MetJ family transcriptional regulator
MAAKTTQLAKSKKDSKSVRASVSFPRELYETLERMAQGKKVSVAWIVRDATEKYVGDQWPLLNDKGKGT